MEDRNLYIKIAHWYYTLGMTQDEIAKRLSFTRQRVNKIINALADMGIVTIKVNGYAQGQAAYESAIEEHFGLKRVIVAESYDEAGDHYLPVVANAASQYLEDYLQSGMTIGVSWGETLAATIANLSFKRRSGCTVVQMVGGENTNTERVKSDEIARMLADKLDCVCYMLCAPSILENEQTKQLLMQEPVIQKSFSLMEQCDVAIFGIGQLSRDSSMGKNGLMKTEDFDRLHREGFIGDICVNPVTIDGRWEDCFIRKRTISANMETLKAIPNVVAVAGGKAKTDAIIGCLASGVIDTLIIDDKTAERIVKKLQLSTV